MPNHITNLVSFSGDEEQIKDILDSVNTVDSDFDFNGIVRMPDALVDTVAPSRENNKKLIDKYGADNWYDWSVNNWGTKWNAYDVDVDREYNHVEFNTAWATPFAFFLKVSKKYKGVKITVKYADEDYGHNVGVYTLEGGVVVNENVPDGGSLEAYKLASDILGGEDYFIEEFFYEVQVTDTELDLENGLNKFCVYILYRDRFVCNDTKPYILKHLEKMAVENENFEYAKELKDCYEKD